jgi:hypothetical protein
MHGDRFGIGARSGQVGPRSRSLFTQIHLWDNNRMSRSWVLVLMAAVGFAGAVAYGRYVAPVEYVETDLSSLRADYRSDLVLMTAERFDADHDVAGALARLAVLSPEPPAQTCAQALQLAHSTAYSEHDLALLMQLLEAVQEQQAGAGQLGGAP